MQLSRFRMHLRMLTVALVLLTGTSAWAQKKDEIKKSDAQEEKTIKFSVAEGRLQFLAPAVWEQVDPAYNMIEAEFKIGKVEGDKNDGRMTVMGSGGSVEENLNRWYAQFIQPDGGESSEKAKVEEMEVNGLKVHYVDIDGTYLDGSPFGAKTERADYRMLAAIFETKDSGNYFLKFYGPKATVAANVDRFKAMMKSGKLMD